MPNESKKVGPNEPGATGAWGRWAFRSSAHTTAPVEVVWPLVGEAKRWKEWSWMTHSSVVRDGVPAPDGVGALRRFSVGPGGSREEVVVWDPPHHLGYIGRSGVPVRNYRADVYLLGEHGGTTVTWQGHFDELLPLTGRAMRLVLSRITSGFATQLCRYADTLDGSPKGTPSR